MILFPFQALPAGMEREGPVVHLVVLVPLELLEDQEALVHLDALVCLRQSTFVFTLLELSGNMKHIK